MNESERVMCGFFHRDDKADTIRTAVWERLVCVLDRYRIHVPAVLVGSDLKDAPLDRGHPVGIGSIGDRYCDAWIAEHVFGLPGRVGRADEDVVCLETHPHDPTPRRPIGAQGCEMHVIGRVEELANIRRNWAFHDRPSCWRLMCYATYC